MTYNIGLVLRRSKNTRDCLKTSKVYTTREFIACAEMGSIEDRKKRNYRFKYDWTLVVTENATIRVLLENYRRLSFSGTICVSPCRGVTA